MKNIIKPIIIIVLFIGFLLTAATLSYLGSRSIYNNGICEKCGGHYEFSECGGGKVKVYIYECDTCGYVIQTTTLMNPED